jgi:hypothetical protein
MTQRIAPSGSAKQLGKVGRSGMHVSSSVERLWTGHATNSEGITSNAIQSQKHCRASNGAFHRGG